MNNEWIRCRDRLPELYEEVLIYRFGNVEMASRTDSTRSGETRWVTDYGSYLLDGDVDVHYWMPLPKAPAE